MRQKLIIPLILFVLFTSCEYKPVPPELWTIGKNKKEFQKVLDYYNEPEDSLKLKAAEYLIENMKGHHYFVSKNDDSFDEFFKNIDSQLSLSSVKRQTLYKKLKRELIDIEISKSLLDGSLREPQYKLRSDKNTIDADFLIENIDYAFKAWELPWSQGYSFNEFCRYILPYRYGYEALEPWRKTFFEQYKWVLDSAKNIYDPIEVIPLLSKQTNYILTKSVKKSYDPIAIVTLVNEHVSQELIKSDNLSKNGIRLSLLNQLHAMVFASCIDQNGLGVSILRSIGIPAVLVTCVKRGDRSAGHDMLAMLDSEKEWHIFNFGGPGPEGNRNYIFPKMFFKNFDKMGNFKLVLEDGSDKIMEVLDIKVEINAKKNDEIYLCVFGDREWFPLFKGENLKSKVLFKNVGRISNMFLAAKKSMGKLVAVSKAFSIDTLGNIDYYEPVYTNKHTYLLSRKYPFYGKNLSRLNALVGGEFSVSNSKDFVDRKPLFKIDSTLNYYNNLVKCPEQKGKYFRYDFPQSLKSKFDG